MNVTRHHLTAGSDIEFRCVFAGFDPVTKEYKVVPGHIKKVSKHSHRGTILLVESEINGTVETNWVNASFVTRVVKYNPKREVLPVRKWLCLSYQAGANIYRVTDRVGFIDSLLDHHPRYSDRQGVWRVLDICIALEQAGVMVVSKTEIHGWPVIDINRKRLYRWLDQNLNRFQFTQRAIAKQHAATRRNEMEQYASMFRPM